LREFDVSHHAVLPVVEFDFHDGFGKGFHSPVAGVTGNMEMRNFVQPYGISVIRSVGFRLAAGRSGRRGAFGLGSQATSTGWGFGSKRVF
jgi:hypothetical protein